MAVATTPVGVTAHGFEYASTSLVTPIRHANIATWHHDARHYDDESILLRSITAIVVMTFDVIGAAASTGRYTSGCEYVMVALVSHG